MAGKVSVICPLVGMAFFVVKLSVAAVTSPTILLVDTNEVTEMVSAVAVSVGLLLICELSTSTAPSV